MDLKDVAFSLLGTGVANLQNGDGKSTIYTVPPAKKAIVTHVVIREPDASLADGTDFDFGDGASADSWKTGVNLGSLTATTDAFIVIPPTTKFTVFDAGDEFGVIPVTGATADATAYMDVFGYEFDA